MKISKNVSENINYIKNTYDDSSDIVYRIMKKKNKSLGYIYLESVSSDDKISEFLNKSITVDFKSNNIYKYLNNTIYNSHINNCDNFKDIFYYLSSGYTILFIEDSDMAIVLETKASLDRGINESTSEPIIRGPKDSFTENNAINLGLIRKRIKDPKLIFKEILVGRRTKSKITISFINDIADKERISNIEKTIEGIDIDGILDSGYIREFITENSLFPQVISTERPDLVSSSLLDGKIVILVENSPYALIVPGTFVDFFHSPEDNYQKPINASFLRILRFLCFFITIITPALYIALMTFNPEIIPNELLTSLASQRDGIPLPTALEILVFVIIFEILRQADIHSPTASGSAMNIVGAIVLGDAGVGAGIVSPIAIIIVAITSICELVFYDVDMISAVRIWRIFFILATTFLGIIGLICIFIVLIFELCSLDTFNVAYTSPISPISVSGLKQFFFRINHTKIYNRANYLSNNKRKLVPLEKDSSTN